MWCVSMVQLVDAARYGANHRNLYTFALSPRTVQEMMKAIDANGDGEIDYREFVAQFRPGL